MRFCRSLPTWLAAPLPWTLSIALQPPTAELDPVLDVVAVVCEPELSDCAWSAASILCRNSWSASAAVVASELEDVAEEDVEDEVDEDPVVVLSVPASVAVVDDVLPTPMVCSASIIAPSKPPPGGGGGALALEVASLLFDPVDWL